jgi:hypothetical protein
MLMLVLMDINLGSIPSSAAAAAPKCKKKKQEQG